MMSTKSLAARFLDERDPNVAVLPEPMLAAPGLGAETGLPSCLLALCSARPTDSSTAAMLVSIRQIGNSLGVVIPKPFLLEAGLDGCDTVEMSVRDGVVSIRAPAPAPRSGWADAALRLAKLEDDRPTQERAEAAARPAGARR